MMHFLTISLFAILQMGWAQSEYCLDGTVWDASLGGCVPEVVACELEFDYDGDGIVGSGDLLDFLAAFGSSFTDEDADGVCDGIDACVGEYDDCGVCNGPGAVYDCGCEECPAFECGATVSYQGVEYMTVLIGDQCWFAENLRNENYRNGDVIQSNLSDADWQNLTTGGVSVYGEGVTTCYSYSPDGDACDESWSLNEYGRMYNWYAVDDARGLCPSGWHVPTDGEWTELTDHLGGESTAGGKLKTSYGWDGNDNSTNSSGFSALPGGSRGNGFFSAAGVSGVWWSSSPNGANAWYRYLYTTNESVSRLNNTPERGFSVRCIRDPQ